MRPTKHLQVQARKISWEPSQRLCRTCKQSCEESLVGVAVLQDCVKVVKKGPRRRSEPEAIGAGPARKLLRPQLPAKGVQAAWS